MDITEQNEFSPGNLPSENNQHVIRELDRYIALENPQFAVLINGEWGSGKTWFIRRYIENRQNESCPPKNIQANSLEPYLEKLKYHRIKSALLNIYDIRLHIKNLFNWAFETEEEQKDRLLKEQKEAEEITKFIYISLFDMSEITEIDAEIIAQLNPNLYCGRNNHAGRLARFVVNAMSITLAKGNDISKSCGELAKALWAKRPDKFVIIFDDVERTKIPVKLILGYASALLENSNTKLIMLSNTSELTGGEELESNKKVFERYSEKVIAPKFTIFSDYEAVLINEIESIHDKQIQSIFKRNYSQLRQILCASSYKNLRVIKKIIYEFSQLYLYLPEESKNETLFIDKFLFYLAVLSIEYSNDKRMFRHVPLDLWMPQPRPEAKTFFNQLNLKYSFDCSYIYCDPAFWDNFFTSSIIDSKQIVTAFQATTISELNSTPTPIKLWNMIEMNDCEVEELHKIMSKEISEYAYDIPGIILHAFCNLLLLHDIGVEKREYQEILTEFRSYIEKVNLRINDIDIEKFSMSHRAYNGLGFHKSESIECTTMITEMNETLQKQSHKKLSDEYYSLFMNIPHNVEKFLNDFPLSDNSKPFRGFIVDGVNPIDLAKRISYLQAYDLNRVCSVIKSALDREEMTRNDHTSLKKWLDKFCSELAEKEQDLPPVAKFSVERWRKNFSSFMKEEIEP